jgi:hypothetical protein
MSSIAQKKISDIRVLYVETDKIPYGIPGAFTKLEKIIGSLKKRKFLGVMFSDTKYWAAVELNEADDVKKLELPIGTVPGGFYTYKKISGWSMKTVSTEIPSGFKEISSLVVIDPSRPFIEFYKSQKELFLLAPSAESYSKTQI